MNTIGCRIKELRIAKGLTQSGLGAVLAIGQKSVSSIEQDTTTMSVKQLETLAIYFGVTTDYLVFGNKETPTPIERDILIEIREDSAIYNALINRVTSKRVIMNAVTV
jgi:transcriptional regulator with XRE-family HTH domain